MFDKHRNNLFSTVLLFCSVFRSVFAIILLYKWNMGMRMCLGDRDDLIGVRFSVFCLWSSVFRFPFYTLLLANVSSWVCFIGNADILVS